jgi:MFS family permease
MSISIYRRAIVLGLLIAVGAIAIDMYIPGFAAIAQDLHPDPGTVQPTMTSFFVALAFGQIIYGRVSNATGRRPPICAAVWVLAARQLPETLPRERRVKLRPVGILITYSRLLTTRRFLAAIMIAACAAVTVVVRGGGRPCSPLRPLPMQRDPVHDHFSGDGDHVRWLYAGV